MRSAYHRGLDICCECYERRAATVVYRLNDVLYPLCDICKWSYTRNDRKPMTIEEAKLLLVKSKL